MAVLERHVEVRQHAAARHQGNHFVHGWVWIDVMQAHPRAEGLGQVAQRLHQLQHARLHGPAVEEASAVSHVDAVGRRVLADHQQFLDAALEQRPCLLQHVADRAAHQVAAHRGDDAEGAAMVAALADLEVRVMARRELDAGRGHQVDEGIVRFRQIRVDGVHHFLRGVRTGHGQHRGMHLPHQVAAAAAGPGAEAAGHDHLAVLGERVADGVQALAHRVVDEAAGVDDNEVRAVEGLRRPVAFGAQLGQDQFGVGERLRAAEAHEADLGRPALGGGYFRHNLDCPRRGLAPAGMWTFDFSA